MKHEFNQRVYYSDTDAYSVAWHGSYLRWMEMARVEFCREIGIDLVELAENDITIPVTNINIRYKSSAMIDDKIVVETQISKISIVTISFKQVIKNEETGKIYTIAEVEVAAVNNKGKLYRRLPEELKTKLEGAFECND